MLSYLQVTLHSEESDVRINSLFDEEASWFNSRVKCFPLYTLMLAINHTEIDALSLGCQGEELQVHSLVYNCLGASHLLTNRTIYIYKFVSQILETIPFNRVNIQLITIHLDDYYAELSNAMANTNVIKKYIQSLTRFLQSKSYKLVKKINHNYIYQLMTKQIKIINNQ